MNRTLSFAFLLTISAPAFGQAVDGQGAQQLSDQLSRYVGKQALNEGILKISAEGDAYKVTFDMKALAAKVPKQDLAKFDFSPITLSVKPNGDGGWSVSSDFSTSGSFEVNNSEGPATGQILIKDGKFAGVYNPELGAFTSGESSIAGMTMTSRMPRQITDLNVGSGSSKFGATKSANGGVDLNVMQSMADFAETVKLDNRSVGGVKTSELVVDLTAKAIRTKPFLDLLAFAVAHEDEDRLKADQAELKTLLLAALPLWERMDGTYTFKNFVFETYAGNLGASQLITSFGADGIAREGRFDYRIKATGLSFPYIIPGWAAKLLPTEFDVKFGGVNIDLDSMSRKAIETFDLNKNPPLPAEFGDQIKADFMANAPKFVVGHSVFINGDTQVALEGEMTFPDGEKPDANLTIDVAGYDKIVASLQEAAKTDSEASQAFTGALAIKGFAKTLPDGRIEWDIIARHDGSVTVNGAMLKGPDPVVEDNVDPGAIPGTAKKP